MLSVNSGNGTIYLVKGDITRQEVEIIVTAANPGLCGGGGVDEAVHKAAGHQLLTACRDLGTCPTGQAVLTPAFNLNTQGVRYVIHAVGPIWRDGQCGERNLLRSAYQASLHLAHTKNVTAIAFPSISTGVYGMPASVAAPIAIETAKAFLAQTNGSLRNIHFVLFHTEIFEVFAKALSRSVMSKDY